jgi:hypothetical protein
MKEGLLLSVIALTFIAVGLHVAFAEEWVKISERAGLEKLDSGISGGAALQYQRKEQKHDKKTTMFRTVAGLTGIPSRRRRSAMKTWFRVGCFRERSMIFSLMSDGVSVGNVLGTGSWSLSPSKPYSWNARLYS